MRALLQLLFQNGGFITLVLVEAVCFYMIVNFNTKQGLVWDTTYGIAAGNLLDQRRKLARFSQLPQVVDSLSWENAALRAELLNRNTYQVTLFDTTYSKPLDSLPNSSKKPLFSIIPATVVSTTIDKANNWVALNRGSEDGIVRNSAVISSSGIVGIVRHVDKHYCLAMSVLHKQVKISALLKGQLGSLVWTGGDYTTMQLNDIAKDIEPQIGDTVMTSGFSSMFPGRYMIGVVAEKTLPQGSNFYSIKVKLSQNPGQVDVVYIVNKLFAPTLDSLQSKIINE
ncbi:MAG: rod shape-determining protein MreC [Bacteroidota bacterium]|jgi:rod shape-determining protein MreC